MERKKDDKFDARGSPTNRYPGEVVKCERNYRRNHLRRYRITRIKRRRQGGRGAFGKRERKRETEVRGGGRRKRPALTSKSGYRQVTLAKQPLSSFPLSAVLSPLRRLPFSLLLQFFRPSSSPSPGYLFPVLPCERVHLRSLIAISR